MIVVSKFMLSLAALITALSITWIVFHGLAIVSSPTEATPGTLTRVFVDNR